MNLDTTKLFQAGFNKATFHDNCTVLDVGSGAFPRRIEIRPPGDDGARMTAIWNGSFSLSVNDIVVAIEYAGNPIWRILDIGGEGDGSGVAQVYQVYESDFGGVALQSDADGKIGIGTATPTYELDVVGNVGINEFLYHNDDPDSYLQWGDDQLDLFVGGLNMLRADEAASDTLHLGDVAGGGDVDVNINNGQVFVQGSDGFFGVGTITPSKLVEMKVTSGFADFKCASTDAAGGGRFEFESGDGGANSIAGQFGSSYVAVSEYTNKMVFQTFGRDIALSAYDTGDEIHFYTGGRTSAFRRVTIDGTGQVGIKTSTPAAQLHVDQISTTAAIPVLYLDQADVSEEMIEFNTTIGTGNAIEAVGAKTLTTTHFIKVTLPGALTRYIPVGTIA